MKKIRKSHYIQWIIPRFHFSAKILVGTYFLSRHLFFKCLSQSRQNDLPSVIPAGANVALDPKAVDGVLLHQFVNRSVKVVAGR